ncbi:hypothetical protein [Clostridium intestinale]|uniref:Uncharacterized protein n=1 Tax=Clostridium intestinale DSM 6191 TaxID=1121320 RepID=A0A1M5TJ58_9CLOT|nr:hypothetical protein [Clostridium intestinale]SHH50403.1 hypothetical protein SAMN02745941_00222 [Clostridium intestinale DSM 6191]
MFKNKLKKIFTSIIIGAVMISPISVSAAEQVASVSNEKDVATKYLEYFVNKDIQGIVNISEDASFPTKEGQTKNVQELLSNPNNHLKSFEFIDETKENDTVNFNVRLNYKNGKIEEGLLRVKNFGESSKVWISDELVDIKTIDEGERIPVIRLFAQLTKFNISVDYSGKYGFSPAFNTSKSYVDINYKQSVETDFTVVKNTLIGNTALSYTATRGANASSGPNSVILNVIPGKSFADAKLRVVFGAAGYSFGEVYAY